MTNATGWAELVEGNVTQAAYKALDTPIGGDGYLMLLLAVVVQSMILLKTQNLGLAFVVGLLFLTGFAAFLPAQTVIYFGLILLAELVGVLYFTFFK